MLKKTVLRLLPLTMAASLLIGGIPVAVAEDVKESEVQVLVSSGAEQKTKEVGQPVFSDINNSVVQDAAELLNEVGVINGYPDGSFRADNSVTRGEYAAMLVRALSLNKEESIPSSPFADVPMSLWSFADIFTVDQAQIMNGYGNGDFGPNDTITYEQALKSLIAAFGFEGSAEYRGGYPWGYALVGAEKGLSKNVGCSVGDTLNRGDVAIILSNALYIETLEGNTFYDLLKSDMTYFYVSPDGDDTNPGTERKPWKTFYYAASQAKPGSEIVFEDGVYREDKRVNISVSGTEEKPIVFTARNNGQAKFIFGEDAKLGSNVFILKGSDYITINGLDITQTAKADPDVEKFPTKDILLEVEGDHCKITNNILHYAFEDGLKVTKNYDTLIENNYIYNIDHEGFDIFGVDRLIANGNEIADCGRVMLMTKGNTRNSVFSNNYLHQKTKRCDTALQVGGSSDNTSPYTVAENEAWENYNSVYYGNIVCSEERGLIGDGIATWGARKPVIFNNIIVGANYGICYKKVNQIANGWKWDPTTVSPIVQNNIYYECASSVRNELMPVGGITSSHNIYYKCGTAPSEPGTIYDDPKFVDPYSDWHVADNSPVRDIGIELPETFEYYDLGVESPNRFMSANGEKYTVEYKDRDGNPRTGKWDMGVYNLE